MINLRRFQKNRRIHVWKPVVVCKSPRLFAISQLSREHYVRTAGILSETFFASTSVQNLIIDAAIALATKHQPARCEVGVRGYLELNSSDLRLFNHESRKRAARPSGQRFECRSKIRCVWVRIHAAGRQRHGPILDQTMQEPGTDEFLVLSLNK